LDVTRLHLKEDVMLTTAMIAGMGDYHGACTGHPLDPRTDEDDDELAICEFEIDELDRLLSQMKAAKYDHDLDRYRALREQAADMLVLQS